MRRIGFTSTIPVEVVYAAGCVPVDLNNVFISAKDPGSFITQAEYEGYPRNCCSWIKGIYSVAASGDFDAIISVVQGDCSQTEAMMDTLKLIDVRTIPFGYPHNRGRGRLREEIERLAEALGADMASVDEWKHRLDAVRRRVWRLDELTWRKLAFSGFENHYYQVCCSDFNSDPDSFEREVDDLLAARAETTGDPAKVRLGYLGVPPIYTDLYDYLDSLGARVVFNEFQRQFSMPFDTRDIVEQYALYTYPYDVEGRVEDISREVKRRKLDGLIHYTQNFCFRQIQDIVLRKKLDVPILTIEGDAPGQLDQRVKIRLESFVEMLG